MRVMALSAIIIVSEATMSTMTVRGCDENLVRILKHESEIRGCSVNKLVLESLKERFLPKGTPRCYDDLNYLAGTWSVADEAEFYSATISQREVNAEDWV